MTEKNIGGRGNQSFERNAAVIVARASGMTFGEMGKSFNLSRDRLVQIINDSDPVKKQARLDRLKDKALAKAAAKAEAKALAARELAK